MCGRVIAAMMLLGSSLAARADSSVAPPVPTVDGVVRGGLRLRVSATLERGGVRLRTTAESADGAEHRMPSTPIYVNGNIRCPGSTGRGFGEGGGGSDGWDVAEAIAPGAAQKTILDRLIKKEIGKLERGCSVTLDVRLERLDGAKVEAPVVAEVTWSRPRPRGEKLEVVTKP